jgi:hypothetical protein
VSKGCKDVRHRKKDIALDPQRQSQHLQKLVAELKGKGKEAVAALPRADRRRRSPAGPPSPMLPDHLEEWGVTKFCTLTERTPCFWLAGGDK